MFIKQIIRKTNVAGCSIETKLVYQGVKAIPAELWPT